MKYATLPANSERKVSRIAASLLFALFLAAGGSGAQQPQALAAGKGKIAKLAVTGSQRHDAEKILAVTGLHVGDVVGREAIQAAADRLAYLGPFTNVRYKFSSKEENVEIEFSLEDAPAFPAFFDNFPWFSDADLTEAIRKDVPFFDGTAPEHGEMVNDILRAMAKLLATYNIHGVIDVTLMALPDTDEMAQVFRLDGPALRVGAIEFTGTGAALANQDMGVIELRRNLLGKAYSRFGVIVFAVEKVRPLFLNRGHLRVEIGKPVARFVGDPAKPLPDNVHVTVAVEPGPVYQWGGAEWSGNLAFGPEALDRYLGLTAGEVAAFNRVTEAWERVREEYGRRGYVDAKIQPTAVFDDAASKVRYRAAVREGPVYRMGDLIITGLSVAAERVVTTTWKIPKGEIFDRVYFESFLREAQSKKLFGELVVHFNEVGHWVRTNPETRVADVLLDFK